MVSTRALKRRPIPMLRRAYKGYWWRVADDAKLASIIEWVVTKYLNVYFAPIRNCWLAIDDLGFFFEWVVGKKKASLKVSHCQLAIFFWSSSSQAFDALVFLLCLETSRNSNQSCVEQTELHFRFFKKYHTSLQVLLASMWYCVRPMQSSYTSIVILFGVPDITSKLLALEDSQIVRANTLLRSLFRFNRVSFSPSFFFVF